MGTIDKCNQLYNDFLEEFPLESLRDMSLEKYTNLNKDSFCYWIENKTQQLGSISGGSSYKFGIYKYKKKPNNPTIIISDNEYAWYKWYNVENRDEAYKKTLDSIIKIAQVASNGKFEEIDEISTLGEVFKWKIAFLYSNKKLIPIYKKDILKEIALELGYNENLKNPTIWDLQNFLLIKKGDKDVFEYSKYLFEIKSGKIIREEENLENKFMSKCSEYIKLLEGAHNLVLTGAPGTGKTYMAREIAKEMGAKRAVMLDVSAPFHCELLKGAGEKLEKEMENVEVHEMNIPIITNVTAEYINGKDDIKKLLKEQVSNSVLWEDSIRKMISDGVDTFIEIGPGKALSGFMKKIDKSMRVFNVEDMASLSNTLIGLRGE